MTTRIVVTGAGLISAIGAGAPDFSEALYAGRSAIGASRMLGDATVTAEIADFSPERWLGNKGIRVLDRTARLLCVATHLGLCGHDGAGGDPDVGLVCGTMFGSLHSIASFDWSGLVDGPTYVNPMHFPNTVINSAAGQAAIKYALRGINSTICAGLASGAYAVHYAAEALRGGKARLLLAGGAEELCEESYAGFRKTNAVSASGAVRPFHPDRDGVIPGEGAALLVLERDDAVQARGGTAWAEIRGFGAAHDAHAIASYQVRAEGAVAAIEDALESAGVRPEQVACVVASASGSRAGDEMELRALEKVFGARLADIPVCAPKAALGETMGASGGFGAVVAATALCRRSLPPTAGIGEDAGTLRLSAAPQPIEGDFALVNAFSCDGNNACLVLGRA